MTQQEMLFLFPWKLQQIEKEYGIHVLYAAESGSRAWGTNSETSDFDVRFIYIRPQAEYLRLDSTKDVLEFPIEDGWDMCGWDVTKLLQLLRNSNSQIYEWFASPIVYVDDSFSQRLQPLLYAYFSTKTAVFHYLHQAELKMEKIRKADPAKVKHYLYSLQYLAAARWILAYQTSPPVNFRQLMSMLPEDICRETRTLLFLKTAHPELPKIRRNSKLDTWLWEEHSRIRQEIVQYPQEPQKNWEQLNRLFLAELRWENLWQNSKGCPASDLSNVQPGDSVFFGRYFYENELDIRPIEWTVLESSETELFLISKYCLDTLLYCAPGAHSYEDCVWENSYLRKWLNGKFYHRAFSEEEKQRILKTQIVTDEALDGSLHENKVFLLSAEQTKTLIPDVNHRIGIPTPYAAQQRGFLREESTANWWLLPEISIMECRIPSRIDTPCIVVCDEDTAEPRSHSRLIASPGAHCTSVRPAIRIQKGIAN